MAAGRGCGRVFSEDALNGVGRPDPATAISSATVRMAMVHRVCQARRVGPRWPRWWCGRSSTAATHNEHNAAPAMGVARPACPDPGRTPSADTLAWCTGGGHGYPDDKECAFHRPKN